MNTPYSCILFDLDGTIVDSAAGIIASLVFTLEQLDLPIPDAAGLLAYVWPPLLDSFRDFAKLDATGAEAAIVVYRAHYQSGGIFDATVYPGVAALLARIHERAVPMSLATSKPQSAAHRVLDHFSLNQFFTFVAGASDDEVRSSKADVITHALENLTALGVDISNPVLVGDREHDVFGAAAHGIPTIMVEWGYGSVEEQTGTIGVASTAHELDELLFGVAERKVA